MATITPVQSKPIQPQATSTPSKKTRTSIFYVNDIHSNLTNLEKIKSASDEFDAFVPSQGTDKLKLSAGDISVGRDKDFSKVGVAFQNATGIMASAGGNHEFDLNKDELAEILKDRHYKLLGLNAEYAGNDPAGKELINDLTRSYIQEVNGTKYGIVGLMPFDFKFHLSDPQEYKGFDTIPIEDTIPMLQAEVDKMKKQGVNKIILLSHAGYQDDVKLAQSVEGIDVIVGGHSHDLIKGIKEGKNLFYSKKTGEPTIITQAGKNGDDFGVLNLEFDENGVISQAQNNVVQTNDYPRSMIMEYFMNKILGAPTVIGSVKSSPKHIHNLIDENPGVNFLADAERAELGVDVAMINAGNIRASIEEGPITDRDLKTITPFDNKLWILRMSEKDLVNSVKVGAKSLSSEDNTPGILQFSGLKYTMTKAGEVKSISFVDKNGKETPIDVNNPNSFRTYRVVVDDFIAKGGNGYLPKNPTNVEKKIDYDKNKVVADHIKKMNKPIEISPEKRITVVNQ